jgi:hypothetical protein
VAVLSGIGGWAGIGVAAGIGAEDPTAGLGALGAFGDAGSFTTQGGVLTVFAMDAVADNTPGIDPPKSLNDYASYYVVPNLGDPAKLHDYVLDQLNRLGLRILVADGRAHDSIFVLTAYRTQPRVGGLNRDIHASFAVILVPAAAGSCSTVSWAYRTETKGQYEPSFVVRPQDGQLEPREAAEFKAMFTNVPADLRCNQGAHPQ